MVLRTKKDISELSDRQQMILTAIIEDFIATAEPVGSRSLTKRKSIELSAATVRNAMADLEELGLLSAPHASAGRVPTASAFRIYVERLAQRGRISAKERELIQAIAQIGSESGDIKEILAQAGRMLSSVSKHASLVLMPSLDNVVFASIEFMPLRERTIVAVFVARSGMIQHRVMEVDFDVDRDELTRMSNYLNSILGGKLLVEVRSEILRAMSQERAQADTIMRQALFLGERALAPKEPQPMLLEGERNFLDQPEFADIEKMRKLLRAFEEKTLLLRLLEAANVRPIDAQAAQRDDTNVVLGAEGSVKDLKGLAAVTSSYSSNDGPSGTVGIVGPTRMDYSRVIPLVEMTATAITQTLSYEDPDKEESDEET